MWKFLVNIFVSLFIPKNKRGKVKYDILGFYNKIRVKRRAKSLGKNFSCGYNEVSVNKNTTIGDNCCMNGLKILGEGSVTFGNYIHAGEQILIASDNHNYDKGAFIPYDNTTISKDTVIGDFVWLGARVTILGGAVIEEGAIIQAGAVVHGRIPRCAIAGGNPAKVFKYRDIEHFDKLKAGGKFN